MNLFHIFCNTNHVTHPPGFLIGFMDVVVGWNYVMGTFKNFHIICLVGRLGLPDGLVLKQF